MLQPVVGSRMSGATREIDHRLLELLELGRANVRWLAQHVDCSRSYVRQRLAHLAAAGEIINHGQGLFGPNRLRGADYRGDAVSDAEVDQWVTYVYLLAGTEATDIGGGVAPRTIYERVRTDTERSPRTIKRHLQADDRVDEVDGVAIEISQRRSSFVPA